MCIYIYIYINAIPTNILHQKQTFFKQKCHAVHDHCAAYASLHRFAKTHTHTKAKITQVATSFRHAAEVWLQDANMICLPMKQ